MPEADKCPHSDNVTKELGVTDVPRSQHTGAIMRIQTTWVVVIGTLIAAGGFVLAIIGFFGEKNTTMGIAGAVITVAAIVATIVLYKRAKSVGRPQFEQALSNDFSPDDQGWFDGAGLAIDRRRRLVLIGTAEGTRRIPFDQIGPVTYHPIKMAPSFGSNSIMALILLPRAISAIVHNARKAGLVVTANGQATRIAGVQPKDADRWQAHLAGARTG